jgi:hypothetical protein
LGHRSDVFKDVRSLARIPLREEHAFSIVAADGATFDVECDSAEDRTHRAAIFAWIVNQSRGPNGVLAALVRSGRISVNDRLHGTARTDETVDRAALDVVIGGAGTAASDRSLLRPNGL